jgi:YidC/Oxa1 family membrane protein insertase
MKNKNLVIFVVLSMGLLLGYSFLVGKLYPVKPMAVPVPATATSAAPTPPPAAIPAPAAPAAPSIASAAPAAPNAATHALKGSHMNLTWRIEDGALVQATWSDGTRFFNEAEKNEKGEEVSKAFPGIGGVLNTRFQLVTEERTPTGVKVHFQNADGEHLFYAVPDKGYAIEIGWTTRRGTHLDLIHRPTDIKEAQSLGRVFTLKEKEITAVAWADVLKDPFFSYLGFKRKEMPPASNLLGMDAGLDKGATAQSIHYFAALWDVSPHVTERDERGYHLAPDKNGNLTARLYLGPKETSQLAAFGAPFTQVVDFGFFGAIAKVFFLVLYWIHRFVPNWGWSIILFTLLLRLLLWPLNTKSTMNMLRMKDFEPHQKALQAKYEKFGGDMTKKAEMQKELMALYKKNNHNPMGGCLPAIVQMPVFFALWSMLNAVYELRHAPWLGWITDLSAKDPHYVLPVLLGVSMLAQQAVTPAVGDPAQRKMMLFLMPAMMTFFFISMPSGLCLYYFVFNIVGLAQTWWLRRNYVGEEITA